MATTVLSSYVLDPGDAGLWLRGVLVADEESGGLRMFAITMPTSRPLKPKVIGACIVKRTPASSRP
jgi:hypothetical protein